MSTSTDRTTWAPTGPTVTWMSLAALVMVGQLYATIPLIDDLGRDLGVGPGAAAWVSTVFGFAYAAAMLVAGPLSDLVGRRRVALTGLVAGAATTVAVAVVPGFVPLLAARAMQGLAIALYAPVALAYLGERIDPRRRSVALTTVIGSFLAAAVLAPLAVLPRLLADRRLLALYAATLTVMLALVGTTTAVQLGGPGGVAGDPGAMQAVRAWALPACVLVPLASAVSAPTTAARRPLSTASACSSAPASARSSR